MPGGQAELLRVPQAHFGPIKVPEGPPDERFLYLSDVLPTAWQAVEYAAIPEGGSVAVFGLGPIGQMCAAHRPAPRRRPGDRRSTSCPSGSSWPRATASRRSTSSEVDDVADALRELTDGRGPDSVIDAVGMEAHGAPFGKLAQKLAGLLPDAVAAQADREGRRRPPAPCCTTRSTRCAAAARSRSAASTAASSTRCR